MISVREKISKWIPSKSDDNKLKDYMIKLYTSFLSVDLSSMFDHFSKRVNKIEYNFVESAITSGAMCFFGSLTMSISQLGCINNIDELFTFAACYILTDHYLDDNTILMKDKKETIRQINNFISNDQGLGSGGNGKGLGNGQDNGTDHTQNTQINSPIIKVVADNYISLVSKIPTSEKYLRKMFQAEVKTMYLQTHSDLDRNTYLKISEWKGGLFTNAIQSILELEVTQADYDLGACIQLIDDILDINDDIYLGINTIVTHDYKTYGNLDKILIYTINSIDKLDKKYNIFKIILTWGFTLAVHNNREKYTKEMVEMMDDFIYYQKSTTKNNLGAWMTEQMGR